MSRRRYRSVWFQGEVVNEHVAIATKVLGYRPPRGVEVHHVDGDTRNNANSNLVICESHAYHVLLHVRQRVLDVGGDPNTEIYCGGCESAKRPDAFYVSKRGLSAQCRECMKAMAADYRRRFPEKVQRWAKARTVRRREEAKRAKTSTPAASTERGK